MILAVPKGTLSIKDKNEISKKGYTIIECDDPDKIRVINPEKNMDTSDWFMAALFACTVSTPTSKSEYFVNELHQRLKKKEIVIKAETTV